MYTIACLRFSSRRDLDSVLHLWSNETPPNRQSLAVRERNSRPHPGVVEAIEHRAGDGCMPLATLFL
jgi:hypothetical protein